MHPHADLARGQIELNEIRMRFQGRAQVLHALGTNVVIRCIQCLQRLVLNQEQCNILEAATGHAASSQL